MKNSRSLLYLITLTSANMCMYGAYGQQSKQQSAERPNILFISIDDLRTQLGAYGHDFMITPNLDRLAESGRLFRHHFVQAPTSGASRAFMLTGQGGDSADDVTNFAFSDSLIGSLEQELPETFIHHLRRNGYYTVGMGKISHSDNGRRYPETGKVDELPYSWDKFVRNEDSPWPDTFDAMLHGADNGRTREWGFSPAFEFKELPDSCYPDGMLSNMAVSELEKVAGQDKPFFMAVGFFKPHLPFTAPKKYWDMYENTPIALSPNVEAPATADDVFIPNSGECFGQYYHPEKGGPRVVLSEEYSRDFRRAYYSALTYTDTQVGKLLDKFYELGLDKNTIIIVWGDHGWHLGDQAVWGKHSTFERALNSTLIVKSPDMKKEGVATDALVATIDIYPTLCELTGVDKPSSINGNSFVDIIKNPKAKTQDYVLSYWENSLSIRDSRYRFMYYNDGKKQAMMLYDHQEDPFESVNVADKNPKVVERMMAELRKRNNGFLPAF